MLLGGEGIGAGWDRASLRGYFYLKAPKNVSNVPRGQHKSAGGFRVSHY